MKDYIKSWQRIDNSYFWKYMPCQFKWDSRKILGISDKLPVCAVPGKNYNASKAERMEHVYWHNVIVKCTYVY